MSDKVPPPPPVLGEHTGSELSRMLGLSEGAIHDLVNENVVQILSQ